MTLWDLGEDVRLELSQQSVFSSCKGKEDKAARSSPGNPKTHIFNICIFIYINLYAPFKMR